MSQVKSVKDLRNKQAKCLVQNRGQTPIVDIKGSSYNRPRTTTGVTHKLNLRNMATNCCVAVKVNSCAS